MISPQKRRLNAVRYRRLIESAKRFIDPHCKRSFNSYDKERMQWNIYFPNLEPEYGESPVKKHYENWLRDNPQKITPEEFRKLYLGEWPIEKPS
jgi:hypothetical protein